MELDNFLREAKQSVEIELERLLPQPRGRVGVIAEAMRFSVFAGGKRLRPAMALAVARMLGGPEPAAVCLGAAIEMIHTFTLIHDDLPAIDNDDLRRGAPTLHKAFGEDIAILAGDALFNQGYLALATGLEGVDDSIKIKVMRIVTEALGVDGVLGGQVLDVKLQGVDVDEEEVLQIHEMKTAALWRATVLGAAAVSRAGGSQTRALDEYALNVGLLFQVMDDILDETGSREALGKSVGKDSRAGKATFPKVMGIEASRARARELAQKARQAVGSLQGNDILLGFVDLFLSRNL